MAITISVGDTPQGIAVNETTNRIYVANQGDNTLSVIDGDTNIVIAIITTGDTPLDVAVNETTNRIYVTNNNDNSVTVIDGVTNTEIPFTSPITVANEPFDVTVNEETNRIYTGNFSGGVGSISTINGDTNTVIDTISFPGEITFGVAVNSKTSTLYVTIFNGDDVKVFDVAGDVNTETTVISLGGGNVDPLAITINETTNRIYTGNFSGGGGTGVPSVSVIDGNTNTVIGSPIPIGIGTILSSESIAVNEKTNLIYTAKGEIGANDVAVIDGNTNLVILPTIPAGDRAAGVAINEKTSLMYVTNDFDNTVSVISVLGSPFTFGNEYHGLWEGKVNEDSGEINMLCGDDGLITGDTVKLLPIGSGTGFTPVGSLIPRVGIVTTSGELGYGVVTGGNKKGIYLNGFRPEPLIVEDSDLLTVAGEENDTIRVCTNGICLARIINVTNGGLQPGTPLTPDFGGTTSIDNFGTLKPAVSGDEVLARLLQTVPIGTTTDTTLRIVAVNIQREGKLA